MRSWTFLRCLLAIAVAAPATWGCGDAKSTPTSSLDQWTLEPPPSVPVRARDDDVNQGPTLYQHYCAVCHGPEGKGDGQYYSDSLDAKPADLTDRETAGRLSEEHISKVIREGSANVGKSRLCPPWGRVFSDKQVDAVVEHVRQMATAPAEQ